MCDFKGVSLCSRLAGAASRTGCSGDAALPHIRTESERRRAKGEARGTGREVFHKRVVSNSAYLSPQTAVGTVSAGRVRPSAPLSVSGVALTFFDGADSDLPFGAVIDESTF
jgi:hypothetical protein